MTHRAGACAGFGYPVTLTMWHMFFCSAMAFALIQLGYVAPVEGMTTNIYLTAIVPIGGSRCHRLH